MVAALHFLLSEPEAARKALGETPSRGWKFTSTRRLEDLIHQRLADAPPALAKAETPAEAPSQTQDQRAAAVATSAADSSPEPVVGAERTAPEATAQADAAESSSELGEDEQTASGAPPAEDIDYGRIRNGILEAADALNAFTKKLGSRIDERKKPAASESSEEAPGPG